MAATLQTNTVVNTSPARNLLDQIGYGLDKFCIVKSQYKKVVDIDDDDEDVLEWGKIKCH